MGSRNYATRMSCFSLISAIESDLRNIITFQLKDGYEGALPEDVVTSARARYLEHEKNPVSSEIELSDLLDFIDFYDLSKILNKISEKQDAFTKDDIKHIAAQLEKLSRCRNRVCHSRPLEPNDFIDLLDFTQDLTSKGYRQDWKNINEARKNLDNPAFALSLSIPDFWRTSKKSIYNNLPLPEFDETGFMGRDKDRKSINRLLASNTKVISIVGEGGIGKTALAQRCLYDILEICEDENQAPPLYEIIVWVSLKTNRLTVTGVEQIQNAISSSSGLFQDISKNLGGGTTETLESALTEVSEYMTEFRTLLCIDNLETISSSEVREFLANIPNKSRVLITTRMGLGEIEYRYKLDKLDDKPSIELMRNMSRLLNLESLATKKNEALKQLCMRLYNNPLLIKWYVLAVAAGNSPADLINKEGVNFKDALRFCFENLYDRLGPIETKVISIIACLRKPVSAVELRFFLDEESEAAIEEALNQLYNSSMLESVLDNNNQESRLYGLTGVAEEYINSIRPVPDELYQLVKNKRKELSRILEESNLIQNHYNYDLNAITWSNRDEKICAIYLKKALVEARKGNTPIAEEYIKSAKSIMPEFSECYRIHSYILKDTSPFKAEAELEKAVEYNPQSAIARYAYAQFLIHEDDFVRAKEQINKALSIDPSDIALRTCKAWVLTLNGDYSLAANLYEELLPEQNARHRKFRISTYDQASNCYKRMAAQSIRDDDWSSAKTNIGRAVSILSGAIHTKDFDDGTVNKLCQILLESEAFYKKTADTSLSLEILSTIDDRFSYFNAKSLQTLKAGLEKYKSICGTENAYKADEILQRISPPKPKLTGARVEGTVVRVVRSNTGVSYGFIYNSENRTLFFHRKELDPNNMLDIDYLNVKVSFVEGAYDKGSCALSIQKL
ncbi:NB-ARC domain-containing protein [Pseudomonas sp. EL_65y_Pfl1_R83]|uniref:NB-ARC domain-containing protein n=1 Tax=Pseudomonas sp. EL_65y_Pfl1_R83 TaxID=3088697 RepID=UPI0030D78F1D